MSQGTTPEASRSFQGCERLLVGQVCLTELCFLYKGHLELRLPAAGAQALVGVSGDQQGTTSGTGVSPQVELQVLETADWERRPPRRLHRSAQGRGGGLRPWCDCRVEVRNHSLPKMLIQRVTPCSAHSLGSASPRSPILPLHTSPRLRVTTPPCLCKCCSHCLERSPHLFFTTVLSHVTCFWEPFPAASTPRLGERSVLHHPLHASPSWAPCSQSCAPHVPPPRPRAPAGGAAGPDSALPPGHPAQGLARTGSGEDSALRNPSHGKGTRCCPQPSPWPLRPAIFMSSPYRAEACRAGSPTCR